MKKLILLILSFTFTQISCTHNNELENIIEFSDSAQTLSGNLFGEGILNKSQALFIEDYLLVTSNNEPFFNILTEDSLITKFGKEGRGPGEYTLTPRTRNYVNVDDSIYTIVYNEISKQVNIIDFTESVATGKLSLSESYKIPSELNHGFVDIFFYKEKNFIGHFEDRLVKKVDEETGIFLYDLENKDLRFGGLFNFYTDPFHLMTEININTRFSTVSQSNEKYAVASYYYPLIEIFDLNDLSSKERYLLEDPPPLDRFTQEAYETEELNQYVQDITSNDHALYLLYVDNDSPAEEKQRMIKVIDWDGNPIDQYRIPVDQHIDQITIHSSGSPLVGVSWGQDALYKYEL